MDRGQPTFQTRPLIYTICIGVLVAWALVGITTGHTYFQYWRAPPADFDGWAAVAFSTALLIAAAGMFLRLVRGAPDRGVWTSSSHLFLASILMVGVAIACELMPHHLGISASVQYTGVVAEGALRRLLDAPLIASWAVGMLPAAFSWLKVSCIGLIGLALVFKVLGVTRETAGKHPAAASAFYLAFGLPFLAWISLELVQYVFGTLPSISAKPLDPFPARASLMLSALLAIVAVWLFALLLTLSVVLKVFGVKVQWQKGKSHEEAIDAF